MSLADIFKSKKPAPDGPEFEVSYSGAAFKAGWMDVESLCTSLRGLADITQEAAKVLHGERLKTQLMIGSLTHKGDTFTVSLKLKEAEK